MKYLIVGLGNVGAEYELTRHNIGFLVADRLAEDLGVSFELSRHAFVAHGKYKGRQITIIKPTTYMNLSGKAMNYWLQELQITKENALVITDDVSLPFGKIRLRAKGSAGGHNGLKNIEQLTGGTNYPRLRFGIGDDYHKGQQVDYVLGKFSQQEFDELPLLMDRCCDAAKSFSTIGLPRTMNEFN